MTTLTEVFPCFFLSCKANARVKPAKTGHGPHSSQLLCCCMYFLCSVYFCVLCIVCFVAFSVLFVCICVLNNCHRVATQVQLNIYVYHKQSTKHTVLAERTILNVKLVGATGKQLALKGEITKYVSPDAVLVITCVSILSLYAINTLRTGDAGLRF